MELDRRYDFFLNDSPAGEGALSDCPFCGAEIEPRILMENLTAVAIEDRYPVSEYHMLILPRRHTEDFFSMTFEERRDAEDLLTRMRRLLQLMDASITGFNIGMNCGRSAGQTVMHAHIHLIPRRIGRGETPWGIRSAIKRRVFRF